MYVNFFIKQVLIKNANLQKKTNNTLQQQNKLNTEKLLIFFWCRYYIKKYCSKK